MTTPPNTRLRMRYQGHEALNDLLRKDWIKSIELSPDRFDALLYLPDERLQDPHVLDNYEPKLVQEIDSNQESLTYKDPVVVPVVDCPDEQEMFFQMDNEGETLGESGMPLLLRVGSASPPPVGSVLEWDEETAGGFRTVWWYVHKSMAYGTAHIGSLTVCIPMRDFDSKKTTNAESGIQKLDEKLTNALDDDFLEI